MTKEKKYPDDELLQMFRKARYAKDFKFEHVIAGNEQSWYLNKTKFVSFYLSNGVGAYWSYGVSDNQKERVVKYLEKCCKEVDKERELELKKKTQLIEEALKGVC